MEDSSRLHAGLGGDNEKLAFAVMKRGLTHDDLAAAAASGDALSLADLGLRYDLTVPLARFYATHRAALPPVFRAIQIAPVWRAERPQKGRYRQFVQCDIDIIGEAGAARRARAAHRDRRDARRARPRRLHDPHQRPTHPHRHPRLVGRRPTSCASARSSRSTSSTRSAPTGVGGRTRASSASSTRGDAGVARRARGAHRPPTGTSPTRVATRRPRGSTGRPTPSLLALRAALPDGARSCSTRPSCAAWATTRARSSRSPTPTSATRSAAAVATTA